jgi:putative transposase
MAGKQHGREFKLEVVRQYEQGTKSKAQLCREHGLASSVLYRWLKEYQDFGEVAFDQHKPLDETQALERKVAQLERLLGQATAENAFLKNAWAAYRKKRAGVLKGVRVAQEERKAMILPKKEIRVSVRRQCQLLELSRASVQYVPKEKPCNIALYAQIENIVLEHSGYGYRRVTHELKRRNYRVNHKRIRRIMSDSGLQCRIHRRKRVFPGLPASTIPNLLRDEKLVPIKPNAIWHADFTYVQTKSGFVYLACVLDGYSRKIIGWSLSKRADSKLVCEALQMALSTQNDVKGLVHHSDQGSQYQSKDYLVILDKAKIRKSMSRKATPGDNAKMESFIRTLKIEEVYLNNYQDAQDARINLKYFIEQVYNHKRLHSSLDYRPPNEIDTMYTTVHSLPSLVA